MIECAVCEGRLERDDRGWFHPDAATAAACADRRGDEPIRPSRAVEHVEVTITRLVDGRWVEDPLTFSFADDDAAYRFQISQLGSLTGVRTQAWRLEDGRRSYRLGPELRNRAADAARIRDGGPGHRHRWRTGAGT